MKKIEIEEFGKMINPFSLHEEPAIVLVSDGKESNGLTVGWAGFGVLWRKRTATIYVHKDRFSKHILDNAKYFSICWLNGKDSAQLDYFGTVSGRDENKIMNCKMPLNNKDCAPYFEQSKIVVLCKKMGQCDFDVNSVDAGVSEWYKRAGVHTQYFGEIEKVLIQE